MRVTIREVSEILAYCIEFPEFGIQSTSQGIHWMMFRKHPDGYIDYFGPSYATKLRAAMELRRFITRLGAMEGQPWI